MGNTYLHIDNITVVDTTKANVIKFHPMTCYLSLYSDSSTALYRSGKLTVRIDMKEDVARTKEGGLLNDKLIDVYLEYVLQHSIFLFPCRSQHSATL